MLGSNQRRLSRRFYRPRAPPPKYMPLISRDALRGEVPSRRRPHPPGLGGTRAGHGRSTRSLCHRTHAETTSRSKPQPRPSREEASQPMPPPDGTARPETGPHYTNWSRPILRLFSATWAHVSARIQHAVRKRPEITGMFRTMRTRGRVGQLPSRPARLSGTR